MGHALLSGKNLIKTFRQGNKPADVLQKTNVDIYEGDFTVIMGSSGAGKSTLLYVLSGMDSLSGGEVFYKGKKISGYSEKQMAELRTNEFGFVFQQTHLVSNLTLFENVSVAGYLDKTKNEKQIDDKAQSLLDKMNVGDAKNKSTGSSIRRRGTEGSRREGDDKPSGYFIRR